MISASSPHTLQGLFFSRGCGCRLGFLGYLPRPVPAQGERASRRAVGALMLNVASASHWMTTGGPGIL